MTPPSAPVAPARALAVLALAVALGCAAQSRETASARNASVEKLPSGTQVVCEMERPTGSHIAEQVCRKVVPAALDIARMQTQNQLDVPKNPAPHP